MSIISVNFQFDQLGIAKYIESQVRMAANRGAFVRNLVNTAYYESPKKYGKNYNVMVFNLSQEYINELRNVVQYGTATYSGGSIYGIWIFDGEGKFWNRGDRGWINWGYKGYFDKDDRTGEVWFKRPPQ